MKLIYMIHQEMKLWRRKWTDCLEKDRPDSLGAAILECVEERCHQNWMHHTYNKLAPVNTVFLLCVDSGIGCGHL